MMEKNLENPQKVEMENDKANSTNLPDAYGRNIAAAAFYCNWMSGV